MSPREYVDIHLTGSPQRIVLDLESCIEMGLMVETETVGELLTEACRAIRCKQPMPTTDGLALIEPSAVTHYSYRMD